MNKLFLKKNWIVYLGGLIVCIMLLFIIYNLWDVNISKPIVYERDSISASYLMKTVDDTGWYLVNPYTGGIFKGDFYDYIMSDGLSMLLVKTISLFTNNVFLIYNLFYFLTYLIVTLTCIYALLQLGVSKLLSLVIAVLYAFLPFHQLRIEHIWLEPYFVIPLVSLVAIWMITGQINWEKDDNKGIFTNIWRNTKLRQAIIISFIASSTGLYYAFFTCCIYIIAFLINLLKRNKRQQLLYPICFILVNISGVIINALPHLLYIYKHGANAASELVTRSPSEAEYYGLKMIQLFLPRTGHRISLFKKIADLYMSISPLTNENSISSLGIVGSIGFVLLMLYVFNIKGKNKLYRELSLCNLGIFLIATIGGVGAVFSYIIHTPMRCYNRLSIVIAFFSLLYIGLILTELSNKFLYGKRRYLYYIGSLVLLLFGVYDQTVPYTAEAQQQTLDEYNNDSNFVKTIENILPAGSMIYQLPHVCFPSGGTYALFKGYINSENLIWSYGGMQGREQDLWEHEINTLSTEEMIKKLSFAGYSGIYIDTTLYTNKDEGIQIVSEIKEILDCESVYSQNGNLVFFDMTSFNQKLESSMSDEEYKRQQNMAYLYVSTEYIGDFSYREKDKDGNQWNWCGSDGLIKMFNPTDNKMNISFQTLAVMAQEDSKINITINDEQTKVYDVSKQGTPLDLDIELEPGENSIVFHTDAIQLQDTADPRELVFYLWNTEIIYR